jgi:cytidine deaminase
MAAAREAHKKAYAPYSKFKVGAAVLGDNDGVYFGCNVENASYGLTICAERSAIFFAIASGVKRIVAVAVYTPTVIPSAPCGACRQVIREFASDAEVRCFCESGKTLIASISELLPSSFNAKNLRT